MVLGGETLKGWWEGWCEPTSKLSLAGVPVARGIQAFGLRATRIMYCLCDLEKGLSFFFFKMGTML